MIIELATVGDKLKPIEMEFGPGKLDLGVDGVDQAGDVLFSGTVSREDARVRIRGEIKGKFGIECSRCLEPFETEIVIPVDAAYVSAGEESLSAEKELTEGDLVESIAESGSIEVADMVREQILLALPDQPLCRETCKGLCPKCGANRNLISCNCDESEIDPRWSALKDLM